MSSADDDYDQDQEGDYERVLVQLPRVHAFRIPARTSADGYRAADWPKDSIWSGKLKVTSKGKLAIIYMMDAQNKIFATCPVSDDGAVERTLDSGRYFVLRIQNAQGKHAFIGIAFNERNDAFDFNVALSEHKSELEREKQAKSTASVSTPSIDFTLKEGEKIKINLGNSSATANREKKVSSSSSGGGFLLAPPPGDGASLKPASSSTPKATPTAATFGKPLTQTTTNDPFSPGSSNFSDPFQNSSDPFAVFDAAPTSQKPKTVATQGGVHNTKSNNGNNNNDSFNLLNL